MCGLDLAELFRMAPVGFPVPLNTAATVMNGGLRPSMPPDFRMGLLDGLMPVFDSSQPHRPSRSPLPAHWLPPRKHTFPARRGPAIAKRACSDKQQWYGFQ